MANSKTSDLTEDTTPADTDVVYVSNAAGFTDRKVTIANLRGGIYALNDATVDGVDGALVIDFAADDDGDTNGIIVKVEGTTPSGYGKGNAFAVFKSSGTDATDQTAAGSILARIAHDGGIGCNGLHVAAGLRDDQSGVTQAAWIDPREDIIGLVLSGQSGDTADRVNVQRDDATKALSITSAGHLGFWTDAGSALAAWVSSGDSALFTARFGATLKAAAEIGFVCTAHASQTANLFEWRNSAGTVQTRINKAAYFITGKTAAPADGDISAGEMALWFDSTNGAAKLMVKAKQANGTVRTGSVALS